MTAYTGYIGPPPTRHPAHTCKIRGHPERQSETVAKRLADGERTRGNPQDDTQPLARFKHGPGLFTRQLAGLDRRPEPLFNGLVILGVRQAKWQYDHRA